MSAKRNIKTNNTTARFWIETSFTYHDYSTLFLFPISIDAEFG
jgi:hypothetical protein